MCDPLTLVTLALTAGSTLFATAAMPDPPKAELPATPAATARNPGATIRVGTGADELENTDTADPNRPRKTQERASGMAIGGLGRSSLAL